VTFNAFFGLTLLLCHQDIPKDLGQIYVSNASVYMKRYDTWLRQTVHYCTVHCSPNNPLIQATLTWNHTHMMLSSPSSLSHYYKIHIIHTGPKHARTNILYAAHQPTFLARALPMYDQNV